MCQPVVGPRDAAPWPPTHSSSVTESIPNASRTRSSTASTRPLAAQHAARGGDQQLRLGAGPGRLPGPPGRGVHHRADDQRDGHEHHESQRVVGLGDGELVHRRGEVVVEQQRPGHRDQDGGHEPADQGDRDDRDQERQHVAGQVELAAQAGQHQGQQRAERHGQQRSPSAGGAGSGRRGSGAAGRGPGPCARGSRYARRCRPSRGWSARRTPGRSAARTARTAGSRRAPAGWRSRPGRS